LLKLKLEENKENTANLYLRGDRVGRFLNINPSVIDITWKYNSERTKVENFIKDIYAESYGAVINVDYPILMSVRNAHGDILAAVGFRYAEEEELFLEQYTNMAIENVLKVSRNKIVEIGNLASAGGGASIFLFTALSSYLSNQGVEYAALTGTESLYKTFKKMGLNPTNICNAKIELLKNNNEYWGSYYDTSPKVIVGSLLEGFKKLQKVLGAEFEDCRHELFSRLHHK